MSPKTFFGELKRRNVYKVAVAYAGAGWALAQGIAQVFPVFEVPNWVVRLIVVLIVIGFPIALILAWHSRSLRKGLHLLEKYDYFKISKAALARHWSFFSNNRGSLPNICLE